MVDVGVLLWCTVEYGDYLVFLVLGYIYLSLSHKRKSGTSCQEESFESHKFIYFILTVFGYIPWHQLINNE